MFNVSVHKFISNKWIEENTSGYAFITGKSYNFDPNSKVSFLNIWELTICSKNDINNIDNEIFFNKIITKNLNIEYKDNKKTVGYTVRLTDGNYKLGIKFDANSNESFERFKEEITKKQNMSSDIIYYDSGNIHMLGQFVEDLADGQGTEFYDTLDYQVKYCGEFENGIYDGSGTFFSSNGKIELEANSISRGLPNGLCKLIIRCKDEEQPLIRRFRYNKDLNFGCDTDSIEFCYSVAKHFYPNLDQIVYDSLSLEQKIDTINDKLNLLLDLKNREITALETNKGLLNKLVEYFWKSLGYKPIEVLDEDLSL